MVAFLSVSLSLSLSVFPSLPPLCILLSLGNIIPGSGGTEDSLGKGLSSANLSPVFSFFHRVLLVRGGGRVLR